MYFQVRWQPGRAQYSKFLANEPRLKKETSCIAPNAAV
jgi:hypothetical protein